MGTGFKPDSMEMVTAVSAQTQHAQQANEIYTQPDTAGFMPNSNDLYPTVILHVADQWAKAIAPTRF
jgi:hypothetical protein